MTRVSFYAPLQTVVHGMPYDGVAEITASGFRFSITREHGGGLICMMLCVSPPLEILVIVEGHQRLGHITGCAHLGDMFEITIALPVEQYE